MKKYAIIVAGGSGKRMKSEIPKQFLELEGKPILMYTLEQFAQVEQDIKIIVVLPENQVEFWKELCEEQKFTIDHDVVVGGIERFYSVKNGLSTIVEEEAVVAIHDGVRPFVEVSSLQKSFTETENLRATTLAVPLKDSIRELSKEGSVTVDRSQYQLVQTPQTFHLKLIQEAYQQPYLGTFTDDASVVEAMGEKVHLIEGDYNNIKITSPEDLVFGEAILKSKR